MSRTTPHQLGKFLAVIVLLVATLAISGCSAKRARGIGRSIVDYDYVVVSEASTNGWHDEAITILNREFVVLADDDPRLDLASVRNKACTIEIDVARGFWSTSGWVEVLDLKSRSRVQFSHVRRGMMWFGASGDVQDALLDVTAARAEGPPLPKDARSEVPSDPGTSAARPKSSRLAELNDLKARGMITEAEYAEQRRNIIGER